MSILTAFRERMEKVRMAVRAVHGQELETEQYQYFLDLNDIRERTILPEPDTYGHSIMRLGASQYDELEMWGRIADMEDHYMNSMEGEGKKIAATIAVGKRETTQAGVAIQLPQVQTQPPPPEEQKKKGLFHR